MYLGRVLVYLSPLQSMHIESNFSWFISCVAFFSSAEPTAQVSFSDQNLSAVRRRCRRCRRRCRKLFTFSSSSPEQLGQFQPNLAQSIPM